MRDNRAERLRSIRIEIKLTPAMAAAAMNGLMELSVSNRLTAATFERIGSATLEFGCMVEFDGEKYRVKGIESAEE